MGNNNMNISRTFQNGRWKWLLAFAAVGTLAAIAISLLVHYLLFFGEEINPYQRSLVAAVLLPILIALPLLASIGIYREALRRLRQERNYAAAHDPSTEVLTGHSFTTLLERRRSSALTESGRTMGVLLIIEAQNSDAINREYGYRWGEEAMKQVASTIRENIRRSDIVGRLNNTEFGVFLPGATVETARMVGERIRKAIERVPFFVEGHEVGLRLDIGGAIFEDEIEIDGVMKIASRELDDVRNRGRDGFQIRRVESLEAKREQ